MPKAKASSQLNDFDETVRPSPFPYRDMVKAYGHAIREGIKDLPPAAPTFPYQSLSDTYGRQLEKPTVPEPSHFPYQDMSDLAKTVGEGVSAQYDKHGQSAINAVHQSDTSGEEASATVHKPELFKGFDNSISQKRTLVKEVANLAHAFWKEAGNPDLPGFDNLADEIRKERQQIMENQLMPFSAVLVPGRPDQTLGNMRTYFYQTVAGKYLFDATVRYLAGGIGLAGNQIAGAITGAARFYTESGNLGDSVLLGGLTGLTKENWDYTINEMSKRLPIVAGRALRALNSVLSEEAKEALMNPEKSTGADTFNKPAGGKSTQNSSVKGRATRKNDTYFGPMKPKEDQASTDDELPPMIIRDRSSK